MDFWKGSRRQKVLFSEALPWSLWQAAFCGGGRVSAVGLHCAWSRVISLVSMAAGACAHDSGSLAAPNLMLSTCGYSSCYLPKNLLQGKLVNLLQKWVQKFTIRGRSTAFEAAVVCRGPAGCLLMWYVGSRPCLKQLHLNWSWHQEGFLFYAKHSSVCVAFMIYFLSFFKSLKWVVFSPLYRWRK